MAEGTKTPPFEGVSQAGLSLRGFRREATHLNRYLTAYPEFRESTCMASTASASCRRCNCAAGLPSGERATSEHRPCRAERARYHRPPPQVIEEGKSLGQESQGHPNCTRQREGWRVCADQSFAVYSASHKDSLGNILNQLELSMDQGPCQQLPASSQDRITCPDSKRGRRGVVFLGERCTMKMVRKRSLLC